MNFGTDGVCLPVFQNFQEFLYEVPWRGCVGSDSYYSSADISTSRTIIYFTYDLFYLLF